MATNLQNESHENNENTEQTNQEVEHKKVKDIKNDSLLNNGNVDTHEIEHKKDEIKEEGSTLSNNWKNDKRCIKSGFTTLFTILLILALAIVSVGSYALIKDRYYQSENHTERYLESNDFANKLVNLTRYLYQSKIQGEDWHWNQYDNIESVKYYITNKDGDFAFSNLTNAFDARVQRELAEKSIFYMQVEFDELGNPSIESSSDVRFNKEVFLNNLINRLEDDENYADLFILYAVPDKLEKFSDFIAYDMKLLYEPDYLLLIFKIGIVSFAVLCLLALSIPYSLQSKAAISGHFNKSLLEVKIFLWFILGFFIVLTGVSINSIPGYRSLTDFNLTEMLYHANADFYIIGIPLTFAILLLTYLSIVYLKYIYYSGIRKGLIENSIIGKITIWILNNTVKQLMLIDIREDNYKKIFMMVGVNFLVLSFISMTGVLGFFVAVAYTVFLFNYLLKLINKAKVLNDASALIAEGNFNIKIDEDMGILDPMAKNLGNIKDGFKLAIEREIKSERMKTELISNVSHDLKTPLTSIITYVDLLKQEDLTEEDKKEYIDILDKKSKRLKVLIEDLFEASKANSGNLELHLEKVDVIALLRQTLGELEEKINESTLQFKLNIPEDKAICELDGQRTYRIFDNIMSNILKYSMPNSRVYIDVELNEQEVKLIFKNISAYEMNFDADEITERFTRGDQARSSEGSGLGLSIAKSLTELQKGKLQINIDGDLFKVTIIFPKKN